jgi:uncharacterized protein YbaP (TraB family)
MKIPWAILGWILSAGLFAQSGQSLLWKIQSPEHPDPSFLFGTIHIRDSIVFPTDSVFWNAFASSSYFAMEMDPDEVVPGKWEKKIQLKQGKRISDLYSAENYALIQQKFTEVTGNSIVWVQRWQPVFILALLSQQFQEESAYPPLDIFLLEKARKAKKTCIGLESPQEQFAIASSIPLSDQTEMLLSWASQPSNRQEYLGIRQAYLDQNLQEILQSSEESLTDPLQKYHWLEKRNRKMAKKIHRIITSGPTFIAVGAAHLPGEKGIIRLLQQMGYSLEPVRRTSTSSLLKNQN